MSNKKVWIGAALAVLAVALAFLLTPKSECRRSAYSETDSDNVTTMDNIAIIRKLSNDLIEKNKTGAGKCVLENIAYKRRRLITTEAPKNPTAVLPLFYNTSALESFPKEMGDLIEKHVVLKGRVEALAKDNFVNQQAEFVYTLVTSGGRHIKLYPVGPFPQVSSGSIVEIRGIQINDLLVIP